MGKGRSRKGGRRRNGTAGGKKEGKGWSGNGEEGNGEEETVGRTGVRQKAERARKGKMAEERKGYKKCGAKAATVVAGLGPTGRESM